jgi:hypothetical protein
MNKLCIASLLTLSAIASAQPTPPTPPGPPVGRPMPAKVCTTNGGALFEEKLELEPDVTMNVVAEKTWRITVYAGGTWQRRELDEHGQHPTLVEGCLSDAQVASIKTELAKATWIVKQHDLACAARGAVFTSYSANGKAVWAEHMCQTAYLDETSAKALAAVKALALRVTTPDTMPCCKH